MFLSVLFSFECIIYNSILRTLYSSKEKRPYDVDGNANDAVGSFEVSTKPFDAFLEPFFFWWFSLISNIASQKVFIQFAQMMSQYVEDLVEKSMLVFCHICSQKFVYFFFFLPWNKN